ncbi:transmembrane protein 272-like [Tachypleus tridentatus]|uniref:transmembrane protein 272-like n=1 Tax=Tachypleus tridentatus TaxID=6853 RepID=UPI003FD1798D
MATPVGEEVHLTSYQIDESNSNNTSPPPYSQIPGTVPIHQGRGSGPPPSYEDVVNPNAPPPTYQSLFGQVREARKNASGVVDFLRKVIVLILGTLGCTVVIGITVVIPFSMIIIGSSYINACPAEAKIPIYLIVAGGFGVLKNVLNFWSRCRRTEEEEQLKQNPQDTILNCFLFAWFIAGCVWIYKIYEPEYDDVSSPYYCNRTVYLFAFWLVTSVYIILGLLTGCLCCLTVSSVFSSPD